MGCRRLFLALAIIPAFLSAMLVLAAQPGLAAVICDGRIVVERYPGPQKGSAMLCVNEQTGQRRSIRVQAIALATAVCFALFAIPAAILGRRIDRGAEFTMRLDAQREAGALPTDAIVIASKPGLPTSHPYQQHIEIVLTFQVNDPHRQPYQAQTCWKVRQDQLQRVEPGQLVAVRINPIHSQEIYPDVEWAVISNLRMSAG